jgi:hypothetical protein
LQPADKAKVSMPSVNTKDVLPAMRILPSGAVPSDYGDSAVFPFKPHRTYFRALERKTIICSVPFFSTA